MRLTYSTLLLLLVSCLYSRSDGLDWEDYVDKETVKIMNVVELGGTGFEFVCDYAEKTAGHKAAAITICNAVFVCQEPKNDKSYKCLLVHEAYHVKQNGKKLKECLFNLGEYGYEYMSNRYLKGHSGEDAYLDIKEEEEARRMEKECLRD